MSDFVPGLEGVVAFETEIAEPDKDGGSLRYRGVDIEELVGQTSFGDVWGLLVDNSFTPGLPPFNTLVLPVRSGDVRVDVQAGIATLAPAARLQADPRPRRHPGSRRAGPDLGDRAVVRRAVGARRRDAGAAERGREGHYRGRAVPAAVARRGRPAAGEGTRRLLGVGRRARAERLDVHRASRCVDRAPTWRRPCRPRSVRCRARCTAARRRGCCTWSKRSRRPATPRVT